jgi:hypothetical protein
VSAGFDRSSIFLGFFFSGDFPFFDGSGILRDASSSFALLVLLECTFAAG